MEKMKLMRLIYKGIQQDAIKRRERFAKRLQYGNKKCQKGARDLKTFTIHYGLIWQVISKLIH